MMLVEVAIKPKRGTILPVFEGGWSYSQKEMTELFNHITYHKNYSILEFGSGDSTIKLHDHFIKHVETLTFYSYESDVGFLKPHEGIQFVHYKESDIASVKIPNMKFDLILVDGPNGDKRALWYSKIRDNVKTGTILLIDDFNHYASFSEELDKNFEYELLSFSNEPPVAYGEHSWKIVRIIRSMFES
jgi:hypothetical protein